MPQVRRTVAAAAAATQTVDLAPFDRFGLGGGAVSVRAVEVDGTAGLAFGEILVNLTVGSDQVSRDNAIAIGVAAGVNSETPAISGVGGPGDPITLTVQNTDAAVAGTVDVVIDIQNVA